MLQAQGAWVGAQVGVVGAPGDGDVSLVTCLTTARSSWPRAVMIQRGQGNKHLARVSRKTRHSTQMSGERL